MKSIAIVYAFLLFCFGAIYLHYSTAHSLTVSAAPYPRHAPSGVAPPSSDPSTSNDTEAGEP